VRLSLAIVGAALALGVVGCGGNDSSSPRTEQSKPEPPPLELVRRLAARVPEGSMVALRARPGRDVVARVGARTEFGSPQTLAVAYRRGEWIAVRSPALGNAEVGWARASQLRLLQRPSSLEVDLSKKELIVHDPGGSAQKMSVAIGAPDTPTPTGDFYVTDKLAGSDFGPTTAAAYSPSRAVSRTCPETGLAATASRFTARPLPRGARPSRTAACMRTSPTSAI
jgi:hypothetical protein